MMKEKFCGRCKKTKSVSEFYVRRARKNGYQSWCKTCIKENKQSPKGKASEEKYNKSEKRKINQKRYLSTEKGKRSQSKYRNSRKWKQGARRRQNIRKTRKTQAGGFYSYNEWYRLCEFYNFHCLRCGQKFPFEKLTLDHIKPISKGGSSFIWNVQPLCVSCNSKKGIKEIDYRKTLPDWINRDKNVWIQDTLF